MSGPDRQPQAVVIGAGPAGLMAAEELGKAGCQVLLLDAKPSVGRKFLMAGKSGLNLTKSEPLTQFQSAYESAIVPLQPILEDFGPQQVERWAIGLGLSLFTGSTGRVFPKAMKASPLLRAWLARLDALGVERRTQWRWTGWAGGTASQLMFDTPQGPQSLNPTATVLTPGGASWSRLGSDGKWAQYLTEKGLSLVPFQPTNVGLVVNWSPYMAQHFGSPLKAVAFRTGTQVSRGEAVFSAKGLEGGGLYALSPALRKGTPLTVDLCPDLTQNDIAQRIGRPRGKTSWSNHLRKQLRFDKVRLALLAECCRPLPEQPAKLAAVIKALRLPYIGLRPLDEAISVAGGVPFSALDQGLMLHAMPGVFCAGEMLDWEAPTGGYLLTACFATGRWVGRAAARYCGQDPQDAD
ncbi:MAG: TIGR03862 family flavoprotein [Paracoccaceae bacterium]|nr:TIGR03862 family flavoprotein [Paracoccaceae bacterium]